MPKKTTPPLFPEDLTGIVTRITFTLSGDQDARIDVYEAGTASARLVLHWGKLHLTFTSAAHVQHLRGAFADARRSMRTAVNLATLPVLDADRGEAVTIAAITWAQAPTAVLSIHQMPSRRLRRPISYLALQLGTITFHILDLMAADSVLELLARAHQVAIGAFPDGHEYRANPTTASWRPRVAPIHHRGAGFIPRD